MYKTDSFYKKHGVAQSYYQTNKQTKGLFLASTSFFGGREGEVCFIMHIASSHYGGSRGPLTHYLNGASPQIPDWLVKIMFLKEVEIAIRSDIKSRLDMH